MADASGQPVLETSRRPETDLVLARPGAAALAPAEPAMPGAADDAALVRHWLDGHAGSTRRAYGRVTERFLCWTHALRHRRLAALTPADLQAYLAFVQAPPADWVQQRRVRRGSPVWRPFQGPLGPASQRHEMAVLASLLGDLHEAGHLPGNPAARFLRRLERPGPRAEAGRGLSPAQWAFALQVLHEKPDTPARRRLQLLLALAGDAGLRPSELATSRCGALRRSLVDGTPVWLLDVAGRTGRARTVQVADSVVALLARHHRDMEAADLGLGGAVTPLQAPCPAAVTAQHGMAAASAGAELEAWRPLLGILRRPPPRRTLDAMGLPTIDRGQSTRGDHNGRLGTSAIDKLLRRFFQGVAAAAAARAGAPPAEAFLTVTGQGLRQLSAGRAARQQAPDGA